MGDVPASVGNYYKNTVPQIWIKPVPFDPEKGEYRKLGEAVNLLYHLLDRHLASGNNVVDREQWMSVHCGGGTPG